MKKTYLFLLVLLLSAPVILGQILTFEFSALGGGEVSATSNSNDANLTSSTITRGAGLTASANGGRFNATSWALTSIDNAVSGDDYMEITITPQSGYQFSVSSIYVQLQRSATGPRGIAVRSSVDNYATNLDQEYAISDVTTTQNFTFTFAQANSSTAVTYRFYMWAEATSGSGGIGDGSGNDLVVTGTVTALGGVQDPSNFAASASTSSQMDLSWTLNENSNNVLVAYNSVNAFGIPTDGNTYSVSDPIAGGGTVIYNGGATGYAHTGLNENTTYYYKAWSVDGSVNYSSGAETNGTTLKNEPTNHATSFSAIANGHNKIDLSWTDAAGGTLPDGYLIRANKTGTFSDPVDGTEEANSTDANGGIVNVTQGSGTYSWIGLDAETQYFFKIWPYTNSGAHIDYKIDGTVPTDNSTTGSVPVTPDVLISEVCDPLDVANAKFVEIYNNTSSAIDFSVQDWYLSRQANGSSWGDIHLTGILPANGTFVIAYNATSFESSFGYTASQYDGTVSGNGNDGYFLYYTGDHTSGILVDSYGVINEDGTGKDWNYLDSRSVRKTSITQPNSTWTLSEWDIASANVADCDPGYYGSSGGSNTTNVNTTGIVDFNKNLTSLEFSIGSLTGSDDVTASKFGDSPANVSGIAETNVGTFRWIIELGAGITAINTELRFYLSALGNHGIIENANDIKLYKRSTPGSGAFTLVGTLTYNNNLTVGDQTDDWLSITGITSFSEFVFASNTSPLPVELTSFSALVQNKTVNLAWKTATEVNNYGFEVERTIQNSKLKTQNWEKIGFVAGNGNSNSTKNYSYTDNNVTAGKYSYRLKQIDNDGQYAYSKEVEVELGIPTTFSLEQNYPNPFNPATVVEYSVPEKAEVTITIFSSIGELVKTLVNGTVETGYHKVSFNASELTSGTYIYQIRAKGSSGNYVESKKMMFIK